MKLNLGCGRLYKFGFVNIDACDSTVADVVMSATDLDYPDNSIETIEAKQIIEHLGYISSIYCLSECFRVLEPKGTLVIETPHIATSFRIYLKGGKEERKNILSWIFGIEYPGMQHKFCFPTELLCEILKKIGFINIKTVLFKKEQFRPTLRIICQKPEIYQAYQIISLFRKELNTNGLINIENERAAIEQEKLIEFLSEKLKRFFEIKGELKEAVYGCINNPNITKCLLTVCIKNKVGTINFFDSVDILDEHNFTEHLTYKLFNASVIAGEQCVIYDETVKYGRKCIDKLIKETRKLETIQKIDKERINLSLAFFSAETLKNKADEFFHKGIKLFLLGTYDSALESLYTSTKLYRDNILAFWNLARLNVIKNNSTGAEGFYKDCLQLIKKYKYKKRNALMKMVLKEMKEMHLNPHSQIFKSPIINLDNSRDLI